MQVGWVTASRNMKVERGQAAFITGGGGGIGMSHISFVHDFCCMLKLFSEDQHLKLNENQCSGTDIDLLEISVRINQQV